MARPCSWSSRGGLKRPCLSKGLVLSRRHWLAPFLIRTPESLEAHRAHGVVWRLPAYNILVWRRRERASWGHSAISFMGLKLIGTGAGQREFGAGMLRIAERHRGRSEIGNSSTLLQPSCLARSTRPYWRRRLS